MAIIDRIDIGGSLFEIKDIAAGTFITREVSDLLYYYTKDNTFTKDEVRALIAQIQGMSTIPVQVLPTASAQTIGNIYLVPSSDPQAQNLYDEYITVENSGSYSWEKFGSASIDMDGYVTEGELTAALADKVDKETGKGLSTNDYTDEDKAKVDSAYQKPQAGIPKSDIASGVIPTALSELSEDATHRTVTDSEKVLWSETNIIHASVISFPAPFSGYTYEQMLAAFGITQDDYIRLANRGGVYSTLMAGSTFVVLGASSGSMFGPVFITGVQGTEIRYRKVEHQNLQDTYSFSSEIVIKGFSGSYNDLTDKPTIPDVTGKADKVSSPTSGNFAGLDANGNLTDSGKKASDFQPTIDNNHKLDYGLLSNTPTIPDAQIQSDWNQSDNTAKDYIKNKPSIPAAQVNSDWNANSGVAQILNKPSIPDAVEANPTVPSGTTPTDLQNLKVGSNYYAIPALPSVDNTPTKNSNNLVKSGGVYAEVHPTVESTQPAGGFAPNVIYDLGTLTGTVTFALASPTDNTIPNPYHWTFDTGSTAPTITWPSGIVWPDGFTPSVDASKHYEVLVRNGYASMLSYSIS